jgi:hypothetical protein
MNIILIYYSTMENLHFKIQIKAPVNKVYRTMLGLENKKTYEAWTSIFNPTSSFEGSWEKGSKIYFIGVDENGKKAGMISKIEEHNPNKFVSILHYGMLDGEIEITEGKLIEEWAGGHENYTFEELENATIVNVNVDVSEEHLDYFKTTYPNALEKLKNDILSNSLK